MTNVRDHIDEAVSKAIQFELDRQVENIIKDAEERLNRAIHRLVANAAISAHDFYKIERQGEDLVITVKLMNPDGDRER